MLTRVAEELVDGLLRFRQARPQLLDDAAHGLPVGDASVQLLHPGFERIGGPALAHAVQAVGEATDAFGLLRMVEIGVLEHGLDVEQAGCDFHRQRR